MRVRILIGRNGLGTPGDVRNLRDDLAKQYVEKGLVEPFEKKEKPKPKESKKKEKPIPANDAGLDSKEE